MIYTYNGRNIDAQPPILKISANKLKVVFKDKQNLKNISFQNTAEKKQFINWLVAL